MVNYSAQLDATFGALADPIRRAMVTRLRRGEATVRELAEPHAVSPPAISKHLRVLEEAGLIRRNRAGRMHRVRLITKPLATASAWMDANRLPADSAVDRAEDSAEPVRKPRKSRSKTKGK